MRPSRLFKTTTFIVMMSSAAIAQTAEETVARQLKNQGYSEIVVEYTLLGRARITAQRQGVNREVIVNPRTGEILRDYSRAKGTGLGLLLNNSFGANTPAGGSGGFGAGDGASGGAGQGGGDGEGEGEGGGDD